MGGFEKEDNQESSDRAILNICHNDKLGGGRGYQSLNRRMGVDGLLFFAGELEQGDRLFDLDL